MCRIHNRLTANYSHTHTMTRKRPTLKETQAMQQLSPEESKRRQLFYQKMAYIEMKKLRPKHPHA